jgi:fermentation-respiration switch protein FrsA (DUF1100 family)
MRDPAALELPAVRQSAWRRYGWLAWRIARVPLVVYLLLLLMIMWIENSLIYFPSKFPAGDWQPQNLTFEDAEFSAADGTRLHGWYVPAKNPTAALLFCHGNAGNLTHRDDLMYAMQTNIHASILVFDYRGYGKSEGSPNEAGVLADARAARQWLAEREGIEEQEIVLMGESIGGALAVNLAARDGARALLLERPITSLPDMAAYHYPWLPVRWIMRGRLNSLSLIDQYHGPVLIAHGKADTIVPFTNAERLFAAANEPKQLHVDRNTNHNDARTAEYITALKSFLESL